MVMMFEVQDLAVASPATVSRCGMVYLEPSILGLSPFVECWLIKLADPIYQYKERFQILFDLFLEVSFNVYQFLSMPFFYFIKLLLYMFNFALDGTVEPVSSDRTFYM